MKHALRQVKARDEGIRICLAKQEARVAAVAAAGVENVFTAPYVECMWTNESPGQGLRMLAHVLECMDDFCRLLGRDFYLVEPLFYHSALHYERHGCDYFIGRDRMDQIHAGFQPGGGLCGRLDGSTPFRRPGFAQTVRGRSWAIHDGVLGEPFGQGPTGVKMYRVPGRAAGVTTFPDAVY